jgi:hypothetical protein
MPFFMTLLILAACSRAAIDQVIKEDIPFNVKEVIHKERVKDGVILLYVTNQKNNQGSFDAVTVAFLKGNDKDGWENAGHNHWEHKDDKWIAVYKDAFYDYDQKGTLKNRHPVIYGKIESDDVQSIIVFGEDGKLEKALIIKKESGRYFIKIGDYAVAKGYKENGRIMETPAKMK